MNFNCSFLSQRVQILLSKGTLIIVAYYKFLTLKYIYQTIGEIILLPDRVIYTESVVSGYFPLDRRFRWDSRRAHSELHRQAHSLSQLAAFDVLDT